MTQRPFAQPMTRGQDGAGTVCHLPTRPRGRRSVERAGGDSTRRHLLAALLLVVGAAPAGAEVLITPMAGGAFGGSTDRTRATYGVALGFLGTVAGFEAEFAFTPSFFGGPELADVFTDNNVVTLMGNVLLATPGPVRVYGTAGIGLLKTRLEHADQLLSVDSNDFGFNAGGGILVDLNDSVSLRADGRYFRDLEDPVPDNEFDVGLGNLDYWRIVGGLTLRF